MKTSVRVLPATLGWWILRDTMHLPDLHGVYHVDDGWLEPIVLDLLAHHVHVRVDNDDDGTVDYFVSASDGEDADVVRLARDPLSADYYSPWAAHMPADVATRRAVRTQLAAVLDMPDVFGLHAHVEAALALTLVP